MKSIIFITAILLLNLSCTTRSDLRTEIDRNDEDLRISEKALSDQISKGKKSKRKILYIDVPTPSEKETSLYDFVESEETESK